MTHKTPVTDSAAPPGAGLPEPAPAAHALALLLQPLARLMIAHGLQLPSALELLKKALVDEALRAYGLAGKGSSDTRVALLTGVHRKDVRRLREMHGTAAPASAVLPAVVARWLSAPKFQDGRHNARALARTPGRGSAGEPDFTTLVADISRDVGARAVLDELMRLGVVEPVDNGYVRLTPVARVSHEGQSESFHFLAANVCDHLGAAVHNLAPNPDAPAMLDQSAFSQDLSAEQAGLLQQQARRLWASALQQFKRTAAVAERRSQGADGPKHRISFGVYFFDSAQPGAALAATEPPAARKYRKKAAA